MEDKDKQYAVLNITSIINNKRRERFCKCYDNNKYFHGLMDDKYMNPRFEFDSENRIITCQHCGNNVDPFYALKILTDDQERQQQDIDNAIKVARRFYKIAHSYKPWLVAMKEIESNVRSGKMLPCCPRCGEGFELKDVTGYVSREYVAAQRRKKAQKESD